jgi:hypothetical protein
MAPGSKSHSHPQAVLHVVRDRSVEEARVLEHHADTPAEGEALRLGHAPGRRPVEFELEGSGEDARIVANTSKVDQIIPEINKRNSQMSAMGGGQSSGGFLSSLLSTLGIGGGSDRAKLNAATDLADEYAEMLQEHLEENGKWERVHD